MSEDQLENELEGGIEVKSSTKVTTSHLKSRNFLSTGSTLLNLACSGRASGGLVKGSYNLFVGDSAAGKTWVSLSCLAEASINKHFDDYRLIYDNGEARTALLNVRRYFGPRLLERMEPPAGTREAPQYSETVQEFYYNISNALSGTRPFIYILDSENSLTSDEEIDKFEEKMEAFENNKSTAGSYGDGKAKVHSSHLRKVVGDLDSKGSILIMLSQTRDNLGFGHEKKTRSGGRALRFYANIEGWLSVKEKLKKTVKGVARQNGIVAQCQIKKNSTTGAEAIVEFPIYRSHGIDDVGGCIDFLLAEKHWSKLKQSVVAPEFDVKLTREALIAHVEQNNLERRLRAIVENVWKDIEDQLAVKRKSRYE